MQAFVVIILFNFFFWLLVLQKRVTIQRLTFVAWVCLAWKISSTSAGNITVQQDMCWHILIIQYTVTRLPLLASISHQWHTIYLKQERCVPISTIYVESARMSTTFTSSTAICFTNSIDIGWNANRPASWTSPTLIVDLRKIF